MNRCWHCMAPSVVDGEIVTILIDRSSEVPFDSYFVCEECDPNFGDLYAKPDETI
jgi:hypothetical protein